MYHLRLAKALSYMGYGLSATKKKPDVFTEDEGVAEALADTGYFQIIKGNGELHSSRQQPGNSENEDEFVPDGIVTDGSDGVGDPVTDGEPKGKTLDEMSRVELETFATYKNVSVKGLTKKSDIVAKLREVLGLEETSGIIEYGSPTMTELQQE